MLAAVLGLALIAAVFLPQLWVERVMRRHAADRPDLPGTGGELARHLLDVAGLNSVRVEPASDAGDHYDPAGKTVRLSRANLEGRSVTAVAIAAHEVAHALQDAQGYAPLALRTRWVGALGHAGRFAWIVLLALPLFAGALTRSPLLAVLVPLVAGLVFFGTHILVHVLTLPVELDASFARALPLLERGGYLPRGDLPAARRVLRAAAWTYVASACATLLNVVRWFR